MTPKFMRPFNNKKEDMPASQRDYREAFGIEDKYLLKAWSDDKKGYSKGYIIFIDNDLDIDWADNRDKDDWTDAEKSQFDNRVAELDLTQTMPSFNLSPDEKLAFKRLLGQAYAMAFERQFDGISAIINAARQYLDARNRDNARKTILQSAGILTAIVLTALLCAHTSRYLSHTCFIWTMGTGFGIVGSYVSIWGRYSSYVVEGVSSKGLYRLEALSRLFIGGIFAFVGLLAINCKLIFSSISPDIETCAYALCGFLCGFSERFIPNVIESITEKEKIDKKE